MEKTARKTLTIIAITITVALVVIILTIGIAAMDTNYEPSGWVLRSYNDTVALFYNGEIDSVYGNIKTDALPPNDVKILENGIAFPTKDEALRALEDYDG